MSRKLDALFAEWVLGWTYNDAPEPYWFDEANNKKHDACFWRPTESLDAAWMGVEKLCKERNLAIKFDGEASLSVAATRIVKACLLTVGVTEDEIAEAERG